VFCDLPQKHDNKDSLKTLRSHRASGCLSHQKLQSHKNKNWAQRCIDRIEYQIMRHCNNCIMLYTLYEKKMMAWRFEK